MSKYIVTSGTPFTPFTYEEMIKPVEQLQQLEDTALDSYDKLITDTATLKEYITDKDPNTKKMVEDYEGKVMALYEALANKGFNASTKRQLMEARKAFASGPAYAAQLVAARQEDSKNYWNKYHSSPDMVMGVDPRTISIDDYWKNPEIGKGWFSYSGSDLEKEVAEVVSRRAQDLYDRTVNSAGIDGYQDVIEEVGFTNYDVNAGIALAERLLSGDTISDEDSMKSQLIAEAIIGGMQTTGANSGENGNISGEQFRRLFEYASRGATAGILDFNTKYLKNPSTGKGSGSGSGTVATPEEVGYMINSPLVQFTNQEALDAASTINETFTKPFQKNENGEVIPINIRLADGTMRPVTSVEEMTEYMTESDYSRKLMSMFEGSPIDVNALLEDSKKEQKFISDNREFIVHKMSRREVTDLGLPEKGNSLGIYYTDSKGNEKLAESLTKSINENYVYPHLNYIAQMQENNKDNNWESISKATIGQKEKMKLYKEAGVRTDLPLSEFKPVMAAKNTISHQSPAVLVGPGTHMSSLAKTFASDLATTLTSAYARKFGKKDSKVGEFALYPVAPGGKGFSDEGINGFDVMNDKNVQNAAFMAYPEDIAEGKMRIIIPTKGEFGFDPKALGTVVYNVLYGGGLKEHLANVMKVFKKPDDVLMSKGKESEDISKSIYAIFMMDAYTDATGKTHYPYLKYAPLKVSENGNVIYYTAKQLIHDTNAMAQLYAGLTSIINERFHTSRAIEEYYNQHSDGNTTKEPLPLNTSLTE